jgi:hypothetical protein
MIKHLVANQPNIIIDMFFIIFIKIVKIQHSEIAT